MHLAEFQYISYQLAKGVVRTISYITGLLVHFSGYDTLVALILIGILVHRIFAKRVGASDRALPSGDRLRITGGKK